MTTGPRGPLREGSYDAVIVGSGFGDGITAYRLAEAAWKVGGLERGRRFGREDFVEQPDQATTPWWHNDPDGVFDLRLFKELSVLAASAVGGGSL